MPGTELALITLVFKHIFLGGQEDVCPVQMPLFHYRTRASYVYNGCLAWYNVVLTHGSTQA